MKGLSALVLLAVVAAVAANQCPADQETNWEIELLLPHENCNQFYKCTYGQPVPQNCPEGLNYDTELQQCNWEHEVDCGDRNVPGEEDPDHEEPVVVEPQPEPEEPVVVDPQPEPEEPVVVDPQPEPEEPIVIEPQPEPEPEDCDIDFLENGCPVNPHIHWLLPNENDCNAYYNCVWGGKVLRSCPSSLHFNAILQVCDWPSNAGCAVSANKHFRFRQAMLK